MFGVPRTQPIYAIKRFGRYPQWPQKNTSPCYRVVAPYNAKVYKSRTSFIRSWGFLTTYTFLVRWAGISTTVWFERIAPQLAQNLGEHIFEWVCHQWLQKQGYASLEQSMDRSLVLNALEMALGQRQPGEGLVHHSDRGSQYASGDFQDRLECAGISCSMSRRGNCWDNAPVESFFGTLKQELVHRCDFVSRVAARSKIFEWLEVWYNRARRHSSLGYISPVEFERRASLAGSAPPVSSIVLLN